MENIFYYHYTLSTTFTPIVVKRYKSPDSKYDRWSSFTFDPKNFQERVLISLANEEANMPKLQARIKLDYDRRANKISFVAKIQTTIIENPIFQTVQKDSAKAMARRAYKKTFTPERTLRTAYISSKQI